MADSWSLPRALRAAVRRAITRMRDRGHHELADRVEADERARVAAGVARIAAKEWMDEFGGIHCARCGGVTNPRKGTYVTTCPGHTERPQPRRAHGIAA